MSNEDKKSSLLIYVGDFIEKHDNELQEKDHFYRDSGVIQTNETDLNNQISESTDIDLDEFSLLSDPIIETRESVEQTYKQEIHFRQYQPSTPEPIDIEVQEIFLKSLVQSPPIHVHVKPTKNRDEERTPSPIVIKNSPPKPSLSSTNESIFYNKYIPVNSKPSPRQIYIHRYPKSPSKPRPIVIEQWFPSKPPPKRITYRRVNHDEFIKNEIKPKRNRYIEYTIPKITIELEIIRLPIIKLDPKEYRKRSNELTKLDYLRSLKEELDLLNWHI